MVDFRRQRLLITTCLIILTFTLYSSWHTRKIVKTFHVPSTGPILTLPSLPAANSTLGFGAIAAVSRPTSSRRESLLVAANVTEIDINIPFQPTWTPSDVAAVKAPIGSRISNGSALAWLGHLNVLHWFLDQPDLYSILILEDDVDWDIHLRTSQIPRAAAATRQMLSSESVVNPIENVEEAGGYWGPASEWDLMYLGHCGDMFKPARWNFRVPRRAYYDATIPDREAMTPRTQKFLSNLEIPERVRVVHKSISPLCTFGFAINRPTAQRLVDEIATRESKGGTTAYDVRILEACRDKGLKCWSANPELFHHMRTPSEIEQLDRHKKTAAQIDEAAKAAKDKEREEEHKADLIKLEMKQKGQDPSSASSSTTTTTTASPLPSGPAVVEAAAAAAGNGTASSDTNKPPPKPKPSPINKDRAPNIACGARSKRFFTTDPKKLEFLRLEVGRKGRCLEEKDLVDV